VQGDNVMFPSIGVTESGKGVMTFTLSGPDFFPSAAFVKVNGKTGAGNVQVIGPGVAPEDGFSGYAALGGAKGVARWGDYSAAVADGDTVWLPPNLSPVVQGLR